MRSLIVYIDHRRIGTLLEGDDLWVFEYDPGWAAAADSFDLSPGLTRAKLRHEDGGTQRPVQWYFDNLLPEELLRRAIEREAGIKGDDAFALLEYLGAESAGSLTLLPPGLALPDIGQLRPLSDAELTRRIEALPRTTLASRAPKRMSLAGAQHKLLVVVKDRQLYEPEGARPSTHILKPNHPDATMYPASVINEYVTMRLAAALGLKVPAVSRRYTPQPVYLIERFDRLVPKRRRVPKGEAQADQEVQRLHIIDACQLLNKARTFKHSGASLEALVEIVDRTTNKIATRQRLFTWLVFNVLVANDDCHLKNLSFHVGTDGVALAPHYDLLSTGAYYTKAVADEKATWAEVRMAFALPDAAFFDQVSLPSMLKAAAVLGVPERVARRVISNMVSRLPPAFQSLVTEFDAARATLPEEVKPFLASESHLLRILEHITLKEMVDRMRE